MRGEINKLMEDIEDKEQKIQSLETQLRTAKDNVDSK